MLAFVVPTASAAALSWQPVETVDIVRGVPDPTAAIDAQGKAVVAYANADQFARGVASGASGSLWTSLTTRDAGGRFVDAPVKLDGDQQALAINSAGAAAVVAVVGGQVRLLTFAAPGVSNGRADSPGAPGTVVVAGAVLAAVDPAVAVDGAGGVTVAWLARVAGSTDGLPNAIQVRRPGGAVETLPGGGGSCRDLSVDVNSRGDAVLAAVCGESARIFHGPAGTADFGPPEQPFAADSDPDRIARLGALVDGVGRVHAYVLRGPRVKTIEYNVFSAVRPPAGPFGESRALPVSKPESFDLDVQEGGHAVAAWGASEDEVRYATHGSNGTLGPTSTIPARGFPVGVEIAAAPRGPAIVSWLEGSARPFLGGEGPSRANVAVSTIGADGKASAARRVAVPGDIRTLPVFAINEAGQAVGTWEQRCSPHGAFAVMAVAYDEGGEAHDPPCQDVKAPKVIAPRKRAILKRRTLRVRLACDEACNATASARVLRAGRRSPIAKGKTRGERKFAARRGATLAVRLTAAHRRRIASALGRRQKLTLRLSVSVRDAYGNGRRWRLKLPVSR